MATSSDQPIRSPDQTITRSPDVDVAIVGAGPVGLTLALALARRGRRVWVLEKDPGPAEHSRAPAVWPGTQEILASLGVIDDFARHALHVPRPRMWDADRDRLLLALPLEELDGITRFPRLLILPQSRTERLLAAAVEATPTAQITWSAAVTALEQDASGVTVRVSTGEGAGELRASYVAGCDGAHGVTRDAIGGSLDGITYGVEAALADVTPAGLDDLPFPRVTTTPRPALAIRMDTALWRLILPYPSTQAEELPLDQRVVDAMGSLFPPVAYETAWKSTFRLHRRMSSRWLDGRIVLAGDAAHLNSPVGGQGMNAGMADAARLAVSLDEALSADAPARLEVYVHDRQRAIREGVNRFTDILTRGLLAGDGRLIRPALLMARLILAWSPTRRRVLRRVAMLSR
ncbi:MAG: FAD-dependent oxidoreductase [Vicinamibacterales bacterium]